MGCGVSKFDANGIQIPARLRPLFHRRIEEIRRGRNSRSLTDTTPSKKELLRHGRDSPEESKVGPEKIVSKNSIHNEQGSLKGKEVDEEKEKIVIYSIVKEEVVNLEDGEEGEGEEEGEEEEDERMVGHEDGEELVFPGSPSFRVYFIENMDDDKNECNTEDGSNNTAQSVDVPLSKDTVTKKEKKERKRRNFRKVIPKGGQAAVKNLLNVRSCYSSAHSSHDRTHLLREKTPA